MPRQRVLPFHVSTTRPQQQNRERAAVFNVQPLLAVSLLSNQPRHDTTHAPDASVVNDPKLTLGDRSFDHFVGATLGHGGEAHSSTR